MTFRHQHARTLAIAAALLILTVSAAQPAQPPPPGGITPPVKAHPFGSPTPGPGPSGLVVVMTTNDLKNSSWQTALNDPYISGVALQIRWSDIENVKGDPDWSTLDSLFATAVSSKKWVHLLIFPGFWSPDWALDGAKTDQFKVQYGPGSGTTRTLPMPWDPVYLKNWLAFVKKVADRYGTSPALTLIAADGPTSVSAEFTLPHKPSDHDLARWQADGYTPDKYIGAWKQVLQAYADDFPRQFVSVSAGDGLPINDKGKLEASENSATRQAIVDQASKILGSRFALQMSDVHAGPADGRVNSDAEDQFIIGYIGSFVTGFQMRSSAEKDASGAMGPVGDPPLALTQSLQLALETGGSGQHVNYVEIQEPDVLAAEMQNVLKNAASAFVPHKPIPPRTTY